MSRSTNTIEILITARDQASAVVAGVKDAVTSHLTQMGTQMIGYGASLALVTAPLLGAFGVATTEAAAFDQAMTNVNAIIQTTDENLAAMSDQILNIGENSRYGPQAVAEGYYTIVGAVADAESHMAILNSAITVAQAGNANLDGSIAALTSTMNAYKFGADDATMVSDYLVRTVQKGVGTMDDFAGALPQVTGMASAMGISFEDLTAQMSYLTTQGFSAAQSSTFLRGMMTSLANPTAALSGIINDLGYESGQAMIEAMGLAGAYEAIYAAGGDSFEGIITSTEALQGAIALVGDGADDFMTNFVGQMTDAQQSTYDFILASEGIDAARAYYDSLGLAVDGLAERTEAIQMDSAAAKADLLRSQFAALRIEVGEALLPSLELLYGEVAPLISQFSTFISENPEVVLGVAKLAIGMAALSGILTAVGTALTIVGGIMSFVLSPIGLLVGAVGLLGYAFHTNFLGMKDAVQPFINNLSGGLTFLSTSLGWFMSDLKEYGLAGAIRGAFGLEGGNDDRIKESWIEGVLVSFGMSRRAAEDLIGTLGPIVNAAIILFGQFSDVLVNDVAPALVTFAGTVGSVLGDIINFTANLNTEAIMMLVLGLAAMAAPTIIGGIIAVGTALVTMAASAAIAMAPFALLGGLVWAVQTDFGGLRTAIQETGDALREGDTEGALRGIANALLAIPMGVSDEVLKVAGADWSSSEGLSAWTVNFKMLGTIAKALPDKIMELLGVDWTMGEGLSAWSTNFKMLGDIAEALPDKIMDLLGVEWTMGEGLSAWSGNFSMLRDIAEALPDKIMDLLGVEWTMGEGLSAWSDNFSMLKDIAVALPSKITELVSTEWTVSDGLNAFKSVFSTIWDVVTFLPSKLLELAGLEFTVPQGLQDLANALNLPSFSVDDMKSWIEDGFITPLETAFRSVFGGENGEGISLNLGDIGGVITQNIKDTLPDFAAWAQTNIVDPFISAISGLVNTVKGAINDIIPDFAGAHIDIPNPITGGTIWSGSVGITIGNPFPEVEGARLLGGPITAGLPYLVGEGGREVIMPGVSSYVMANREAERLMRPPAIERSAEASYGSGQGGGIHIDRMEINVGADQLQDRAKLESAAMDFGEAFARELRARGG